LITAPVLAVPLRNEEDLNEFLHAKYGYGGRPPFEISADFADIEMLRRYPSAPSSLPAIWLEKLVEGTHNLQRFQSSNSARTEEGAEKSQKRVQKKARGI
jgi:hypothetical protein